MSNPPLGPLCLLCKRNATEGALLSVQADPSPTFRHPPHSAGPCPFYGVLPVTNFLLISHEDHIMIEGEKTADIEMQNEVAWRVEKSLFGPRRKVRQTRGPRSSDTSFRVARRLRVVR